ncbi:DoxX family protein [Deminuibacter soli]|uniref:DoxX family membrane protein n=1 Tax=Deminuibacter soli TaxID=2291815 RepID=A0A3E1NL95_9BACT|nr:hypothetical protein [Deminuibacter soli]RFM28710.1 hypothetical protein DXN05_07960 [Deminuibacter soli]
MKPLTVLLTVFSLYTALAKFTTGGWQLTFGANLAMCAMLCLTASGHFLFTRGMVLMMPPFVPYKKILVYLTGIVEVLLGFALLLPTTRPYAAFILIVLFILLLPANIYAALNRVNMEKATHNGPGARYLVFRIPLQLFFIGWICYFSL